MEKVIVFQGDSITDSDRDHSGDTHAGRGYVSMLAGHIGVEYSGKYKFYNRGICAHRSIDIYARIKKDIINLKPDILSILIGVNDVWHEITEQNGVDTEKFEMIYNLIIKEVKQALPDIKIVLLEPFVLNGRKTCNTEENPTRYVRFRAGVLEKAAVTKRIAKKHGLIFVPLQEKFDSLSQNIDTSYWLFDGVHPTLAGHEIIKREWLKHAQNLL